MNSSQACFIAAPVISAIAAYPAGRAVLDRYTPSPRSCGRVAGWVELIRASTAKPAKTGVNVLMLFALMRNPSAEWMGFATAHPTVVIFGARRWRGLSCRARADGTREAAA